MHEAEEPSCDRTVGRDGAHGLRDDSARGAGADATAAALGRGAAPYIRRRAVNRAATRPGGAACLRRAATPGAVCNSGAANSSDAPFDGVADPADCANRAGTDACAGSASGAAAPRVVDGGG